MNYSDLLSRAFRLVRTVPPLWQLGILLAFVGGGTSSLPSFINTSTSVLEPLQPTFLRAPLGPLPLPVVLLMALVGGGVVLLGAAVHYVVRVGLIDGSARAYRADPFSLRSALKRGLSFDALRLFAVNVVLFLPVLLLGLFIAAVFFLALGVTLFSFERQQLLVTALAGTLAVVTVLAFIGTMVLVSALTTVLDHWSARFIVLGGRGVVNALQEGWSLFRAHWQTGTILWLIHTGLILVLQFIATLFLVALALFLGAGALAGQVMGLPSFLVAAGTVGMAIAAWGVWTVVQGNVVASLETLWTLGWLTLVEREAEGESP